MLVCLACTSGPLDAYQNNIAQLYIRFPHMFPKLAAVKAICRFERWPVYRLMIEEMVERGQPPKFFNKPWAAVILMAAQDENWWNRYFVAPCLEHRGPVKAARAAALVHSNYLPEMIGDNFEDFCMGPGRGYVPGPYSARPAPQPTCHQQQQKQQQQQAAAAAAAANDSWWQAAPPAWAAEEASLLPDGRNKKFNGKNFCWGFCTNHSCTDPCPGQRAHRC